VAVGTEAARPTNIFTRIGGGVIDQGVSSLTNLFACVAAARVLSARDFGFFSVALVLYVLALALGRACSGEPLVVRHSSESYGDRDSIGAAAGTSVIVGVVVGVLLVMIGVARGGEQGAVLIALGVGMPFLLLQDAYRFAFFAAGRPDAAVINDSLWLFGQIPLLLVAVRGGSPALFVTAWVAGAVCACLGGAVQTMVVPELFRSRAWLRRNRDLIPSYAATFLFGAGTGQLTALTFAVTASVSEVGAYRGAWTLIGPLGVVLNGVAAVSTADVARTIRDRPDALPRLVDQIARLLFVVALGFAVLLMLALPRGLGQALLGATWRGASGAVAPLALGHVALALALAPAIALQAAERASQVMRIRVGTSVAVIATGMLAGAVWGPSGTAFAFAAVTAFTVPIFWRAHFRMVADVDRGAEPVCVPLTA
jgi:O-antigen/teichoic acid export membrane protein